MRYNKWFLDIQIQRYLDTLIRMRKARLRGDWKKRDILMERLLQRAIRINVIKNSLKGKRE